MARGAGTEAARRPAPPGPAWLAGAAVGALACLSQVLLPVHSEAWSWAFLTTSGVATTVLVASSVRMRGGARPIWWMLTAYAGLTFAGDVVYTLQEEVLGVEPFPGPADVLFLSAYACAVAALVRASRRLQSGRDRDALIDAAIITLAFLAVGTAFVFGPLLEGTETLDLAASVALAYPVLDLLVLAALVRLVIGVRRLELPLALVTVAFAATLVADLVYQAMTVYGESDRGTAVSEALYLATFVLLAAASAAPGASAMADPADPTPRPTSVRILALTAGVLTAPIVTLIIVWPDERSVERFLAACTILVILLAVLRIRGLLLTVESQADQLGRQARTDSLTGLPNRRTLDYELERTVQQASSAGLPLSIAMLDLDHFKSFNDRYGHQAGDALLRASARAWSDALPSGAFLARYGGEEFALLLPGRSADDADPLLERLRAVTPPERTVSIGYAQWRAGETGFQTLHRADQALYAAKEAGRDRVVRDGPDGLSAEASSAVRR